MKTRNGYVSNSSSSSFVVCFDDKKVFDFLEGENKYYETFMNDIDSESNSEESKLVEFFHDYFIHILYNVEHRRRYPDIKWWGRTPEEEFKDICEPVGAYNETAKNLFNEGVEKVRECAKENDLIGWRADKTACKFAHLMIDEIRRKWKNVRVFGYSDEDGEFWSFMEHEFMGFVADKGGDGYAVITRSEH